MSDREKVAEMLKVNGKAGSVEVSPNGDPEFQYFVAQAGPFDEGTPVVVLGPKEADELLELLTVRHEEGEVVGWRVEWLRPDGTWRPTTVVHWTPQKPDDTEGLRFRPLTYTQEADDE